MLSSKAELSAHAQRMSCLFALDKVSVPCQAEGGHKKRGRRWETAAQVASGRGPTGDWAAGGGAGAGGSSGCLGAGASAGGAGAGGSSSGRLQGTRGAHIKHLHHVRDARNVEAQRLVELPRALPTRKGRHTKQGEVRARRREGGGRGGGASRMQGRARLEVRGEGTHRKHAVHVCDAGRVEAQRLVELLSVLPSRKDGT